MTMIVAHEMSFEVIASSTISMFWRKLKDNVSYLSDCSGMNLKNRKEVNNPNYMLSIVKKFIIRIVQQRIICVKPETIRRNFHVLIISIELFSFYTVCNHTYKFIFKSSGLVIISSKCMTHFNSVEVCSKNFMFK